MICIPCKTLYLIAHRLVVTKEISNTIHEIDLIDAVEKVLPVIASLGKDTDDSVKEALAGELDKIIYYYYEVRVVYNTRNFRCV